MNNITIIIIIIILMAHVNIIKYIANALSYQYSSYCNGINTYPINVTSYSTHLNS